MWTRLHRVGRREMLVLSCWCGLLLAGLYLGAWRQPGLPAAPWLFSHRFLTPEIAAGREIGQLLTINGAGFCAVVLRAVPAGRDAAGEVLFRLYEVGDEGTLRPVRMLAAPAREVVSKSTYAAAFLPIRESAGRRYRLSVSAPEVEPGGGIRLWASDGRSSGDAMLVDEVVAFAELAYETRAITPWRRLADSGGAGWRGTIAMAGLLGACGLASAAILAICLTLVRAEPR